MLIRDRAADHFSHGACTEQHAEGECGVGGVDSMSGEVERQVLLDSSQRVRRKTGLSRTPKTLAS